VLSINGIPVDGSFVSDSKKLYAVCRAVSPNNRFEVVVRRNVALEDANRKQVPTGDRAPSLSAVLCHLKSILGFGRHHRPTASWV
jgi:hypothetical protein